jgi:hypothetical protein
MTHTCALFTKDLIRRDAYCSPIGRLTHMRTCSLNDYSLNTYSNKMCTAHLLLSHTHVHYSLTLIRAAGGIYDFRNLNRYNSTVPEVTKKFKIYVFLKKRIGSISCRVLLSEKRRFRRFISQKVRETARFSSFSYILVRQKLKYETNCTGRKMIKSCSIAEKCVIQRKKARLQHVKMHILCSYYVLINLQGIKHLIMSSTPQHRTINTTRTLYPTASNHLHHNCSERDVQQHVDRGSMQ